MVISVILSFKNEENNLMELYRRISVTLEEINEEGSEIIFVNDASNDSSQQIVENIMKNDYKVKCINMTRSFGVSECVIAGLEYCKGDFAVYLDSDLQDPPELIPKMLELAKITKSEVVKTHRVYRQGESKLKLFITSLGYKYLGKFSNIKIDEEVGDFTLLSRRAIEGVLQHREQMPFLRGIVANLNYPSQTLDYVRNERFDGAEASKFRIFNSKWMRSHLDRTLISFSDVPLKLGLAIGFGGALFSFFGLFVVLGMKILHLTVPGWAALIFVILFIGGIQLTVVGILGLYINVIYQEVKGRPLFVIESIKSANETINPLYFRTNKFKFEAPDD